jgi:ethanolamine ammonia-lyase small subunit
MEKEPGGLVVSNPWADLRRLTPARIALGHSGTSIPTAHHLAFQLAHARARDAVHHELDANGLKRGIEGLGVDVLLLASAAESRAAYLQRPDEGRRLDANSREILLNYAEQVGKSFDVVLAVGDGLSAFAIEKNAEPLLRRVVPLIIDNGWRLGPIAIVRQARVAIGDEIGQCLGAKLVVMLIGERPGLSSPDSLGIYMTYAPQLGVTDESRNCISNVRSQGLTYEEAARKLMYLVTEASKRQQSGVLLKDETEGIAVTPSPACGNFLIDGLG